jgi:beta-lactam-binding protein with PASTA domain
MRKLAVAAMILVVLALVAVGGWAVWLSDDTTTTTESSTAVSTSTIPLVLVPTEIGKNGFFAALDLRNDGLGTSVIRTPSVSVARNRVISQRPLPGTLVPRGTVIELTISSGPR